MKRIQIVGLPSTRLTNFTLQLISFISRKWSLHAVLNNSEILKIYGLPGEELLTFEGLTISHELGAHIIPAEILVTDHVVLQADVIVLVVEQTLFSVNYLEQQIEKLNGRRGIIVYLDFMDNRYSGAYWRKFHLDRFLTEIFMDETTLDFDDRDDSFWLTQQLGASLSLKGFSKHRLLGMSEIAEKCLEVPQKESLSIVKISDRRWRVC